MASTNITEIINICGGIMIKLREIRKNIDEYIKSLENELLERIKKEFNDFPKGIYYCLKNNIKTINDLLCPRCKKNERNIKDGWVFCSRYCQHSTQKGKKRPGHSEWMFNAFKEGKYEKFRNIFNSEINTVTFKKKRLENNGYRVNDLCEEEIMVLHSKLKSDVLKSLKSKRKSLQRFIKNNKYNKLKIFKESILNELTEEQIQILDEEKIDTFIKLRNSIISVLAISENPTMGCSSFFKRQTISGLKYNMRNLTMIVVKSSYESNYINFFEKNEIFWDYEILNIPKEGGFYTPDFVFEYNNSKYILETKGVFYRTTLEEYCNTKLKNVLSYCKENNFKFLFSFNPHPNTMLDILGNEIKEDVILEVERLYSKRR